MEYFPVKSDFFRIFFVENTKIYIYIYKIVESGRKMYGLVLQLACRPFQRRSSVIIVIQRWPSQGGGVLKYTWTQ